MRASPPLLFACVYSYAHFRGFQKIEGLEAYYNLKALWLESNGLMALENLSPLRQLRCLYVSKNLIERIENLDLLQELNTLDLSENRIKTLSGLACLSQLSSLNLARNQLETSDDLKELSQCKQLTNLDISNNAIEDQGALDVLRSIPQLRALRITGNAVVSSTKSFRKVYIAAMPQLSFLDRPIFPIERASVAAWAQGGNEAELNAKRDFVQKENDERRRTLQEFRDWQAQVREKRIQELDAERALKELSLNAAEPEDENSGDHPNAKDDVDLRGFRGITREQYLALPAAEQAVWDERIKQAHADSVVAKYGVLGDGVKQIGTRFWASEEAKASTNSAVDVDPPSPLLEASASHDQQPQEDAVETTVEQATQIQAPPVEERSDSTVSNASTSSSAVAPPPAPVFLPHPKAASTHDQAEMPPLPPSMSISYTPDEPPAAIEVELVCSAMQPQSDASGETQQQPPRPSTESVAAPPAEPRETWSQLQQRAYQAPFLHRPLHLPSMHSVRSCVTLALDCPSFGSRLSFVPSHLSMCIFHPACFPRSTTTTKTTTRTTTASWRIARRGRRSARSHGARSWPRFPRTRRASCRNRQRPRPAADHLPPAQTCFNWTSSCHASTLAPANRHDASSMGKRDPLSARICTVLGYAPKIFALIYGKKKIGCSLSLYTVDFIL